jgi:hypothetical protein
MAVAAEPDAIVICAVIFVPPFTFAVMTASAVAVVPSIIDVIFEIVPAFGATTKQDDDADILSSATLSTYVFNSVAVAVKVVPPIVNVPVIAGDVNDLFVNVCASVN